MADTMSTPPQTPHESIFSISSSENDPSTREIRRLTNTARFLGERLKARDDEFQALLGRLSRTSGGKKRQSLWEQSNAVATDLMSLQSVYREHMANLISVKAQSSETLREDFEEKAAKQSCDSGICLTTPPASSDGSMQKGSLRSFASRSSLATSNRDPLATSRMRKLSGLSTAFTLYSHYFYPWMRSHSELVKTKVMENRWPAQAALRNDACAQPVSYDGFIPDGSPCAEPALWLLAAVVAALSAVLGPVPAKADISDLKAFAQTSENEPGDGTKVAQPRSMPRLQAIALVAEVFDSAAAAQWMKRGQAFSTRCFAARLRADMGFWEAFARERGLVAAALQLASHNETCRDDRKLSDEDRGDLFRLLVWLVGARDAPATDDLKESVIVKSQRAKSLVTVLIALGLEISCESAPGADDQGTRNGQLRIVSLREASGDAALPLPVIDPVRADTVDGAAPVNWCLTTVHEEGLSEGSEDAESDPETDDTSVDEENIPWEGKAEELGEGADTPEAAREVTSSVPGESSSAPANEAGTEQPDPCIEAL